MAGGDLDVSERDAGVEGRHDEGRAQHVGVDEPQAGPLPDGLHPAVGGAAVEALAVPAEDDRADRVPVS